MAETVTATATPPSEYTSYEVECATELLARRKARKSLIEFAKYVIPDYKPSRCHHLLAEKLEAVERGEITRLIVNYPRRHGKSLLVSILFPIWCLGRNSRLKFVQCGYAENLTLTHSRKARDLIAGSRFHMLFPKVLHRPETAGQLAIATPLQSASEWGTTDGGNYYAVGVGGGLAGRGFSIGLIDDPIRGREDANSANKQEKIYDWFRSVFYPAQDSDAIKQEGAIVICMTRWNPNDLAARVQEVSEDNEDAELWDVLSLPAINDAGEALWPERWPIEKLEKIKAVIGGREFAAQYQQTPRSLEGNILDHSKLIMVNLEDLPPMVKKVRRWDLAFSENKGADFVAGALMGIDSLNRRYIIHVRQYQSRWPIAKGKIVEQAATDGLETVCAIEANGTQLGYFQDVKDDPRMSDRVVEMDKPEGSKEMRASVWGSRLEDNNKETGEGIVYCVRGAWNQLLFDQMDEFSATCEHDDIIDSISGGWKMLGEDTEAVSAEQLDNYRTQQADIPSEDPLHF